MKIVKMSIELDNFITEISDVDKTNCEYCEIKIINTFKKFAMLIGGEHLWNEIVHDIAMEYDSKKYACNTSAEETSSKDYRKLKGGK